MTARNRPAEHYFGVLVDVTVALLDQLGARPTVGRAHARALLATLDVRVPTSVLLSALRLRKARVDTWGPEDVAG